MTRSAVHPHQRNDVVLTELLRFRLIGRRQSRRACVDPFPDDLDLRSRERAFLVGGHQPLVDLFVEFAFVRFAWNYHRSGLAAFQDMAVRAQVHVGDLNFWTVAANTVRLKDRQHIRLEHNLGRSCAFLSSPNMREHEG